MGNILETGAGTMATTKNQRAIATGVTSKNMTNINENIDNSEHPSTNSGITSELNSTGRGSGQNHTRTDTVSQNQRDQFVDLADGNTSSLSPKIAFLFTGQGAEYLGMAKELYVKNSVFCDTVNKCLSLLDSDTALACKSYIANEQTENIDGKTSFVLFIVEYALAVLWQSWGVKPSAVLGHSFGEIVAATVAGVMSLNDALELVALRHKWIRCCKAGCMVVLFENTETVADLIRRYGFEDQIFIAVKNSDSQTVVSGRVEDMTKFTERLQEDGLRHVIMKADRPFHTKYLSNRENEFKEAISKLQYNTPNCSWVSSFTGDLIQYQPSPEFWLEHAKNTVEFAQAVTVLAQDGIEIFIEIGPKPLLLKLVKANISEISPLLLPSLVPGQSELQTLLSTVAELTSRGCKVQMESIRVNFSRRMSEHEINQSKNEKIREQARLPEKKSAKITAPPKHTNGVASVEPIAIVGMACRIPGGADTTESFWEMLVSGKDGICERPSDRYDYKDFYGKYGYEPQNVRHAAYLKSVLDFDAEFFGISKHEADILDPQQRLLLEVSWEAFENANIDPNSMKDSNTGVFMGLTSHDFEHWMSKNNEAANQLMQSPFAIPGIVTAAAAGRISNFFAFEGPSMVVDTACSSSLVGIHLACQSLRLGECNAALAGGAHLLLSPHSGEALNSIGVLSQESRSKSFDANADGFGRGEGCGVVLLKRLADARASNDRIFAVIRGSAVNQNGANKRMVAPRIETQVKVMKRALNQAKIEPQNVGYIEAHGTGTRIGDPMEVAALTAVYGANRNINEPYALGSVKANIGHLEAAAGVAGVIKSALMLHHKTMPPHPNFTAINPRIDMKTANCRILTKQQDWLSSAPRTVGVSSLGMFGANAHALIQEDLTCEKNENEIISGQLNSVKETCPAISDLELLTNPNMQLPYQICPLSAQNESALRKQIQQIITYCKTHPNESLQSVCRTLQIGRAHLSYRTAVVAKTCDDLVSQLESKLLQLSEGKSQTKTAFFFPDAQQIDISVLRSWYETHAIFKAAFDKCSALFREHTDMDLNSSFLQSKQNGEDRDRSLTNALVFSAEYALAALWQSWGLDPEAVFGEGIGQVVASVASGSLHLQDAITKCVGVSKLNRRRKSWLNVERSKIEAIVGGTEALPITDDNGNKIVPSGKTSSWDPVDVTKLAYQGNSGNVPWMKAGINETIDELIEDRYSKGNKITNEIASSLTDLKIENLVELGINTSRSAILQSISGNSNLNVFSADEEGTNGIYQSLATLAELYVHGVSVDWEGFQAPFYAQLLSLPSYPFQRKQYFHPLFRIEQQSDDTQSHVEEQDLQVEGKASSLTLPDIFTNAASILEQQYQDNSSITIAAEFFKLKPVFDELAYSYVALGLKELGFDFVVGHELTMKELQQSLGIVDDHFKYLKFCMDILCQESIVRVKERTYITVVKPLPDESYLKSRIVELKDEMTASSFKIEALLLARCGENLPGLLRGTTDILPLMFPPKDTEAAKSSVEALYHDSSYMQVSYRMVSESVCDIARRVNQLGRSVRILEVGAGTGGTTKPLLYALNKEGLQFEYTYTDISPVFFHEAQMKFGTQNIHYQTFNAENSPYEQGIETYHYDIVLGANVIHATKNIKETRDHIRMILNPGGVFMMLEPLYCPRPLEVVFGLVKGWQRYDDEIRQKRPWLSKREWQGALVGQDFTKVHISGDIFGVILACASDASRAANDNGHNTTNTIKPRPERVTTNVNSNAKKSTDISVLREQIVSGTVEQGSNILENALLDIGSRITNHPRSMLLSNQDFTALGFDSIMIVEFQHQVQKILGKLHVLTIADMMQNTTAEKLAHYLCQKMQSTIHRVQSDKAEADQQVASSQVENEKQSETSQNHLSGDETTCLVAEQNDENCETCKGTLVKLQTGNLDKLPLFIIHGSGGSVDPLKTIAAKLNRDVYGIKASPCLKEHAPSIETLANNYIALMKSIQQEGPYHVAGWSMGGVLVYEISERLHTAGDRLGGLILIDSYTDYSWLQQLSESERKQYHAYQMLAHKQQSPENISAEESASHISKLVDAHILATKSYQYKPCSHRAPFHIYHASEMYEMMEQPPKQGWEKLLGYGFTINIVESNHYSILKNESLLTGVAQYMETFK